MPIGIGVNGGLLRQTMLENVSYSDAQKSLQQIKMHLSQPGRDSGVLTLFNRTSTATEMTLERKSGFQLLFQKDDRLDDTVSMLKTLLKQAGKDEAVAELEDYLRSQGGKQNRIESGKMLEILNRHLAPSSSSVDDCYVSAKLEMVEKLGSGASGTAFRVKVDGQERVLKTLGKPQPLTLARDQSRPNEAIASYLSSKQYPDYLLTKVSISQPTSYVISTKKGEVQEYRMVSPREMRSVVKEAMKNGWQVLSHGILMPKVKGEEVRDLMDQGTLTQTEKKQFVHSTLYSIKGLNERGFVHRDLKPANILFDREYGVATLIDTGLLFKSSKDQGKNPGSQYVQEGWGTPKYLHPRVNEGKPHGTEADLHALGIMALEVQHPVAFKDLMNRGVFREPVTMDALRKTLEDAINDRASSTAPSPEVRTALAALLDEMKDPDSMSGFAMECLRMAGKPLESWGDREWAQKTYANLLKHPALQ